MPLPLGTLGESKTFCLFLPACSEDLGPITIQWKSYICSSISKRSGPQNLRTHVCLLCFIIISLTIDSFPSNIMRDNMLINPSGIPGRAMGIDLNIEHLIRYLKVICRLMSLLHYGN